MMGTIDSAQLQVLANLDFETFKTLASVGQNRAEIYYRELATQAQLAGLSNVENYAQLAEAVINESTIDGILINKFTEIIAEENNISFSQFSEARYRVQYEAMQNDIDARIQKILNGGTGELNAQETVALTVDALEDAGLPAKASILFTPLSVLAEHDPEQAELVFDVVLATQSLGSFFADAAMLGFGSEIDGRQSLAEILQDFGAQAEWAGTALGALRRVFFDYSGELDVTPLTDPLLTFEKLFELGGAGLQGFSDWAEWFSNVNPGDIVIPGTTLPAWLTDVFGSFNQGLAQGSPLVLDLDGDGIELLSQANGVYWDIDEDGFAESSGWVAPDDGLLAIDANGNGIIDEHAELFGDLTTDGFAVLSALDTNNDNIISAADAQFSDLLVWQDANSDGVSQVGELSTLSALGIVSIDLNASISNQTIEGNDISHTSSFTMTGGTTRDIVDAWFAYNDVNTIYASDYQLDIRTLFLPTLRGYGTLPDLHIAMSLDETLLEQVEVIALADEQTLFDPAFDLQSKLENILFRWAGADGIDPASRGPNIDARQLAFVEKLLDDTYIQNVGAGPAELAREAYQLAYDAMSTRLLAQSAGSNLLIDPPTYDPLLDSLDGQPSIDFTALGSVIADIATSSHKDLAEQWLNLFRFLDETVDLSTLLPSERAQLDALIAESDPSDALDFDTLMNVISAVPLPPVSGTVSGDENNNILVGTASGENIYGGLGNDIVYGLGGNDNLIGNDGNDTYVFEADDGDDIIDETAGEGTDTIFLSETHTPGDVQFWNTQNQAYLRYGNGPSNLITIYSSFNANGSQLASHIERIVFANGTLWDLTQGLIFNDTDDSHSLFGGQLADDIKGNGGNDILHGYAGNDVLNGGTGNDDLRGGGGDDSYVFKVGDGTDVIDENLGQGRDTIYLTGGIEPDDLVTSQDSSGTFHIRYSSDPNDKITIYASKNPDGTSNAASIIEQIVFDSGLTLPMVALTGSYNVITGTPNPDSPLNGTAGADQILGLAGNDVINGLDGDDDLQGEDGDDIIDGGNGADIISGGAGDDTLTGRSGNDTIHGGIGADILDGKDGDDTLNGDDGDDLLKGESGNDVLNGGAGEDDIRGHGGSDIIKGGDDNDLISGGAGDDTINGNGGDDEINGEAGRDTIYGDAGDDLIRGHEDDDLIYGGAGNDELYGGNTYTDAYASNDEIHGEVGNDLIYGRDGDDLLYGGSGVDGIDGGDDDDIIYGGDGHDNPFIAGNSSSAGLRGERGNDMIYGGAGDDWISGGRGDDYLYGGDGNDTIEGGEGHDHIYGGLGNDTLKGDSENDYLYGEEGDDLLRGHDDQDILFGGIGNDQLEGYAGLDRLFGGGGADTLYGYSEQDRFYFDATSFDGTIDSIMDFSTADYEKIIVTEDALVGYDAATSAIADFITTTTANGHTSVFVDRDGTGAAHNAEQIAIVYNADNLTYGNNFRIEPEFVAS